MVSARVKEKLYKTVAISTRMLYGPEAVGLTKRKEAGDSRDEADVIFFRSGENGQD